MIDKSIKTIIAPWPENVVALTTTKYLSVEAMLNSLPKEIAPVEFITQVHGNLAIEKISTHSISDLPADAVYTFEANTACVVKTADCLPILIYCKNPQSVAAIHAGWRSLASGIIENTLTKMNVKAEHCNAWFGPAISQTAFQVGEDVYQAFTSSDIQAKSAFIGQGQIQGEQKYLADLTKLARQRLNRLGIAAIDESNCCTFKQDDLFFSYRKHKDVGRMVSLIYFKGNQ